jgi:hypothetical protein
MSSLREIVVYEWGKAIESGLEVRLPELADHIIKANRTAVELEYPRLALSAVLKLVRDVARSTTDESGQLELFGFPSVIAVPKNDGDFVYIKSTNATFEKLEAGRLIRVLNVDRAQTQLDQYTDALEKVRPLMAGTDKILLEAIPSSKA